MILIINPNQNNARLCQDNKWRERAEFGDHRSFVKVYKLLSAALKKAKAIGGEVVEIPADLGVDSNGTVHEVVNSQYHARFVRHQISEFKKAA